MVFLNAASELTVAQWQTVERTYIRLTAEDGFRSALAALGDVVEDGALQALEQRVTRFAGGIANDIRESQAHSDPARALNGERCATAALAVMLRGKLTPGQFAQLYEPCRAVVPVEM